MPPGRSGSGWRRVPAASTVAAQWPLFLVFAVVVVGFVYPILAPTHWLRAAFVVAVGCLLGGVLRLVLPEHRIGLLAVRERWWDCVCYVGLGVLIITIGLLLPR